MDWLDFWGEVITRRSGKPHPQVTFSYCLSGYIKYAKEHNVFKDRYLNFNTCCFNVGYFKNICYLWALIYRPIYAENFSGSTDAIYATKIINWTYNDNHSYTASNPFIRSGLIEEMILVKINRRAPFGALNLP